MSLENVRNIRVTFQKAGGFFGGGKKKVKSLVVFNRDGSYETISPESIESKAYDYIDRAVDEGFIRAVWDEKNGSNVANYTNPAGVYMAYYDREANQGRLMTEDNNRNNQGMFLHVTEEDFLYSMHLAGFRFKEKVIAHNLKLDELEFQG